MRKITKNNIEEIILDLSHVLSEHDTVLIVNEDVENIPYVILISDSPSNSSEEIKNEDKYKFIFISTDFLYSIVLRQETYFLQMLSKSIIIQDKYLIMREIMLYAEAIINTNVSSGYNQLMRNKLLTPYYLECLKKVSTKEEYTLKLLRLLLTKMNNEDKYSLCKTVEVEKEVDYQKTYYDIKNLFISNDCSKIENLVMDAQVPNDIKADEIQAVSVFFEGIYKYSDFVQLIFIPLCKELKEFLFYSNYTIKKHKRFPSKTKGVLVSFYFAEKSIGKKTLIQLKRALFNKVSELKLEKIHIDTINDNYRNWDLLKKETNIFQCLSSELLVINADEPINESRAVTRFIYYYILAGIYFYPQNSIFFEKNEEILNIMFSKSISEMTLTITDITTISVIKNKLNKEYTSLYNRLQYNIEKNYHGLFNMRRDSEMDNFSFLSQLTEIYDFISTSKFPVKINHFTYNADISNIDLFFVQFIKESFDYFFVEEYYKAFVPFTVKKITNEKF
ncbi:hypothetical protein [Viscerimonas tarda]